MLNHLRRLSVFLIPLLFSTMYAVPSIPTHVSAATLAVEPFPLPRGCGGVTPPGEPLAACCLNGFVYIDGQPVAGAEVQIQSPRGDPVTLVTQVYSGTETRPFYQLSLSAAPLNIVVSDTITVTARYSAHEQSLSYRVQPNSQQVDVVLPRNQPDDYVFERQIWGQAEPGKFNEPRGMDTDSQGNLYLVDTRNARIQVFTSSGQFLRQWGRLGNLPGQFTWPTDVAFDASDHLYVTDARTHRVQKFTSQGVWLASWGSQGSADGQFERPGNLATDRHGAVYVADTYNNRIQKFDENGTWLATWGTTGSNDGQFSTPTGIAVDPSGKVYVADYWNSRIQLFNEQGTWLATWVTPGDGSGPLAGPHSLAIGADNFIYVTDIRFHRIMKFSANGSLVTTFGSPGSNLGQFGDPEGITVDHSGNIYVGDTGNQRVQHLSSSGAVVTSWGTVGWNNGQFTLPKGVAVASDGTIYVADTHRHRLQQFTSAGEWLATLGSSGGGNGQFDHPHQMAFPSGDVFYVADTNNFRIQQFSRNGTWLKSWGNNGTGNGQFAYPIGVTVDQTGNVYVADAYNHRIQKFTSSGVWLAGWGSLGSGAGQFNYPWSVAVDTSGAIYVADKDNHRIQKFNSNGTWLVSWGEVGTAPGQFSGPTAVVVDSSNNVYVTDAGNHRIQKFTSAGVRLASWGAYGSGEGQLIVPWDLAVHGDNVYVADTENDRLQVFRPMTATKPLATIQHLSATTLVAGTTLTVVGLGQDSDATPEIAAYEWAVDTGPFVAGSATFTRTAEALGAGLHTLTLQVRDGEGERSDPVSRQIYVSGVSPVQWGMLLYLDGDFADGGKLAETHSEVISDLLRSFKNPLVQIAVQVDGPKPNDTRRFVIKHGTNGQPVLMTDTEDLGERAMDDPAQLTEFVRWGQDKLLAQHYYLAIANHGQGFQGIAWDNTSGTDAYLTVAELHQALAAPGVAPIDILHLDACSMDLLELAYELRQQVRVMIASQYLTWSFFAYDLYQGEVSDGITPTALAQRVVGSYAALSRSYRYPFTLAALNTQRAEPLLTAVDQLAVALNTLLANGQLSRTQLITIRTASQKLESNGDYANNDLDWYVDLLDWARQVQLGAPAVSAEAQLVLNELLRPSPDGFILAQAAQSGQMPPPYGQVSVDLTKASGVSLFYPPHLNPLAFNLYASRTISPTAGLAATGTPLEFAISSRWVDFLQSAVAPGPAAPLPDPLPPLIPNRRVFLPLLVR